jgi:hypothetical protein
MVDRRCLLDRETALQSVVWGPDDWPRLQSGRSLLQVVVEVPPGLRKSMPQPVATTLDGYLSWKQPVTLDWFTAEDGQWRLRGRQSLASLSRSACSRDVCSTTPRLSVRASPPILYAIDLDRYAMSARFTVPEYRAGALTWLSFGVERHALTCNAMYGLRARRNTLLGTPGHPTCHLQLFLVVSPAVSSSVSCHRRC